MIDAAALPREIRATDRALLWRREEREGKPTKVPYRTGQPHLHARVNDPSSWGSFDAALANVQDGKADGVGLVLGDGIVGVDLDKCRVPETGEIEPWAREIVEALESYTEVSPSGTGLHVLARGELPPGRRRKGRTEMYADGRYFTLTGERLDGTPRELHERTGALAELHARIFGTDPDPDRDQRPRSRPAPLPALPVDDRELLEKARAASNGGKFASLWDGDASGYDSASEADLALANLLAFWSRGDAERIDRLFRRSGLMRDKWEREDYRERTIGRALEGRTEFWEPERGVSLDGEEPPGPQGGRETLEPEEPTRTDTGNASRLITMHGERLRFIPRWGGKWLVEETGFWSIDHEDVRVQELAKDVGRQLKCEAAREEDTDRSKKVFKWGIRSLSSGRIAAMVKLARGIDGIPLDYSELDADGWLLGVENGVVDLRAGELRPADPDDLLTLRCAAPWDEGARAPRWERAMKEWFPDPEVRGYVKRVAGAALVGGQRDHVMIIHYGTGRNGKGTFVRALQQVLGPYAGVVHLSLLVQQKHNEHDTVKAELFRKRLAVASETERRVELREASVKNLTGGDRITCRRMREDPWEFDPTHSIWLQTNHLPEIAGRDRGIWSRLRVVRWEETFTGEDRDPELDNTLAGEAPGILRWLVEGCLEWQRDGLAEPEAVVRDTLDYRRSEDTLARFQADVGLAFRPDLEIHAGELQGILTDWAQEEGVQPPRQEIGDWLRDHDCRKTQPRIKVDGKVKRPRVWIGVGIEGAGHETEQTDALA